VTWASRADPNRRDQGLRRGGPTGPSHASANDSDHELDQSSAGDTRGDTANAAD
jgi:hypothetical protein